MPASLPEPRSTPRLGTLDSLRFIAASSVVAFHFTARNSPAWNGPVPNELSDLGQWTSYGRMGVPLFFVISGFVLLMSSWGRDIPSFVASRVGRLFPAFWVAAGVSIVLVLYVWPENPAFFGYQISTSGALLNLTMVNSAFGIPNIDGVYWTLWYEARFYLLIALLMMVGITRARILAFTALWPIVGAVAASSGSEFLITLLMPDYAPFFAGGMLLYLIYREGHDLGTWLLVGLQGLFALNFSMQSYPSALASETPWPPSPVIIALITFACFALVALATLTPAATWNARWMGIAGALTYPLYLIHENVGWFVISRLRDSIGSWGAVLAATATVLVAAVLLHSLVEKPFGPRLRRATLTMLRSSASSGETRNAPPGPAVRSLPFPRLSPPSQGTCAVIPRPQPPARSPRDTGHPIPSVSG